MSSPFAITAATNTVLLDNNRQGQTSFTVSNTTPHTIRGRARIVAQQTTGASWLMLLGEIERDFPGSGSQQYVVQITVPPGASAGDYTFRLDVVDLANPDDNFSEGPTVKCVVPAPVPVKKPFPWWIVAAVVGVLILLGGGIYGIIQISHKAPPSTPQASLATPTLAKSTWTSVAPMPVALFGPAAVRGLDGKIYVIGDKFNEVYDPKTNTWTSRTPMPIPRSFLAAVLGPDGLIYALGGVQGATQPFDTVEAYDPNTDKWTPLDPMPIPRYGFAAVLGPDKRIYVFGGNTDSIEDSRTVDVYDFNSKTWTSIAPMLSTRRVFLAGVLGPDGRIYAIGGTPNASMSLNSVEAYDFNKKTWTPVAPMLTGRSLLAAVVGQDRRIYALGGRDTSGKEFNTVEAYDFNKKTWTPVAPMLIDRSQFAAVVGQDQRIYALGGDVHSTVEAYGISRSAISDIRGVAVRLQSEPSGLFVFAGLISVILASKRRKHAIP
jgi:N-acetylneuraminic acid mutarotase